MTSTELRKLHQAHPFHPFEINIADGSKIRVNHPELLAISPSGRTIAVYSEPEAAEIVDLLLVTSLKQVNGQRSQGKHRQS